MEELWLVEYVCVWGGEGGFKGDPRIPTLSFKCCMYSRQSLLFNFMPLVYIQCHTIQLEEDK